MRTKLPLALCGFFIFVHPILYTPEAQNPLIAKTGALYVFGALLAVWACVRLWEGEEGRSSPLQTAFLGAVLWTLLSLLWASSAEAGRDLALSLGSLAIVFIALGPNFQEAWIRGNMLRILSWLGAGLAAWGLWQWMASDAGDFGTLSRKYFSGRPVVGFGNPNFYAGYLVPFFGLTLCRALFSVGAASRWFMVMTSGMITLAVWASGCRSALIALFAVGIYVGLRGRIFRLTPRLLWGTLGATLVLGIVLTQAKSPQGGQGFTASAEFRWETWKGCFREIVKQPLLGHGVGSFRVVYPRSRSLKIIRSQEQSSYETLHAHNWFLETWCEQGVVGLGLWIWLGVCLFRLRSPPGFTVLIAQAGILGFLVDNLLNVTSQHAFGIVVPAMLLMLAQGEAAKTIQGSSDGARRWIGVLLIPAVIAVACVSLWQAKVRFRSEVLLARAVSLSQSERHQKAEKIYEQALDEDPDLVQAWYFAGQNALDLGSPEFLEKALKRFRQVQRRRPDYVLVHFLKSKALYGLGRMDERRPSLARALVLDPGLTLQTPEYARGRVLALEGRFAAADRIFEGLASLCGHCPEAVDALKKVASLRGS